MSAATSRPVALSRPVCNPDGYPMPHSTTGKGQRFARRGWAKFCPVPGAPPPAPNQPRRRPADPYKVHSVGSSRTGRGRKPAGRTRDGAGQRGQVDHCPALSAEAAEVSKVCRDARPFPCGVGRGRLPEGPVAAATRARTAARIGSGRFGHAFTRATSSGSASSRSALHPARVVGCNSF